MRTNSRYQPNRMSREQIEDKIERIYEMEMNILDKKFLAHALTVEQYEEEVKSLDRWAKEEYQDMVLRYY